MIYLVILILFILLPILLKYLFLKRNPSGQRLYFDESEITILIEDISKNLSYNNIKKIVFTREKRRIFLIWPKREECIKIFSRERPDPYIFYRSSEKKYFDQYKEGLKKFAKKNRISLVAEN